VHPILTRLLHTTTKEILAVPVLSEHLVRIIKQQIISNYVHSTSFASLAFLSSPETTANVHLTPVLISYFTYLHQHAMPLQAECDQEQMLATVLDPQLRRTFKTAEFQSIGHLLETCQKYRHELQTIRLLSSSSSTRSCLGTKNNKIDEEEEEERFLQQATRDMQREIIAVNGTILPRVTSREQLLELLANALNSPSILFLSSFSSSNNVDPYSRNDWGNHSSARRKSRHRRQKRGQRGSSSSTTKKIQESSAVATSPSSSSKKGFIMDGGDISEESFSTAGEENQTDGAPETPTTTTTRHRRRNTFQLSTVDMLTKRLLLSASRTGTGGDAYFVVRDLFGGEDVEVVPSQLPHGVRTIDLIVRLASVTIRCYASFDVYPKSMIGDCEPLIQIHTTTTESIGLQEVRANASPSSSTCASSATSLTLLQEEQDTGSVVMILQERPTENSGCRILSIRPALYEKVEVWNTPS
jgi:hypothetical protein